MICSISRTGSLCTQRSIGLTKSRVFKRNYNTIIDRVSQSPMVNLNILGCISIFDYMAATQGLSAGTTLLLMGSGLRLSHNLVQVICKRVLPQTFATDTRKKLFLNDLEYDSERYLWSRQKLQYFRKYYTPSHLLSCGIHAYSTIILFKAVNRMCKYNHYYPELLSSGVLGQGIMNLSTVDPTWILPSCVAILNFMVIRNLQHPFCVNYARKFSNLSKLTQCAIVSSICVALPKAYLVTWIGYITTHLAVRSLSRLRMPK
ncbi:unnamed protein product [Moneuplotes crassus]|uniref:Uncharacterized protein n=1 Tax=Euplotes crassus TaxID=5936 RepID=A0AAD1XTD9_EUPCR|nr:unnamed protein product [Moneuplotes crassus]